MRFPITLAAMFLLSSGCERQPEAVDTTLPAEKAAQATPPPTTAAPKKTSSIEAAPAFPCMGAGCRIMTPQGWAGIRAGMKVAAAMRASGFSLKQPGHYDEFYADEPDTLAACNIYELVGAPDNLSVFVEHGIITSLGVGEGQRFETDRGVGVGDPEAAVRRAYPQLKEEPDIYSEPPDKKLFFRSSNGNGIKFSINSGRVSAISAGGASIAYVEGCL